MIDAFGTKYSAPFSEAVARTLFRDVLLGLEFIHFNNIVHCDLKPDNLLLTAEGTVKIADFGVSTCFSTNNDMMTGISSSPAFTAPEACSSDRIFFSGRAADVWSLGVSLFVMTHGFLPFYSSNITELYEMIATKQ